MPLLRAALAAENARKRADKERRDAEQYGGSRLARDLLPVYDALSRAVATVTGLVAKENVVGTFGILFGGFEEVAENGWQVWQNMRAAFTPLAAYSFLMFNLLCAPCFSAVGAIRREMNSLWWTGFAVLYQTVLAYAVSLVFYQLGMLFQGTPSPIGVAAALTLLFAMLYMILRRADDQDPRAKAAADAL